MRQSCRTWVAVCLPSVCSAHVLYKTVQHSDEVSVIFDCVSGAQNGDLSLMVVSGVISFDLNVYLFIYFLSLFVLNLPPLTECSPENELGCVLFTLCFFICSSRTDTSDVG